MYDLFRFRILFFALLLLALSGLTCPSVYAEGEEGEEGPSGDQPQGGEGSSGGDEPQDNPPGDQGSSGGDTPDGSDGAPPPVDPNAKAIVVVFNSGVLYAGFAGEDQPSITVPFNEFSDMGALETALRGVYEQLGVPAEAHPILLSEHALNPTNVREDITKLMFDTFKVPSFYLAVDGVLAVYGAGRTTGIAVVISDNASYAIPVYGGFALPHAIIKLEVGRQSMVDYLIHLLGERSDKVQINAATAVDILEKAAYVAYDFDAEMQKFTQADHSVNHEADGTTIKLENELVRSTEIIFKPTMVGIEHGGIHQTTYDAIMKCDVDLRKDLYSNTVLTGSASTFKGLAERLTKEMTALAPPSLSIKIIAAKTPYDIWVGGSILSGVETFKTMWITQKDYSETGPSIVGKKAP